jgi:hypothetical protein
VSAKTAGRSEWSKGLTDQRAEAVHGGEEEMGTETLTVREERTRLLLRTAFARTVGHTPLPRDEAESVSTDDREYYHEKRLRSLKQVICS